MLPYKQNFGKDDFGYVRLNQLEVNTIYCNEIRVKDMKYYLLRFIVFLIYLFVYLFILNIFM